MNTVSVVIPVHNVEEWVRPCLESLVSQTHSAFEAIIVDDGSTDSSAQVCEEFASGDPRFLVIRTAHEGVAAARNLAVSRARGKYCFFLDPDDLLERDSLEYLVDLIERTGCDIALGTSRNFIGHPVPQLEEPVERVYRGKRQVVEDVMFDKRDLRPADDRARPPVVNYEFFSSLYKTRVLQDRGIQFLPITYGEDTFVLFSYLLDATSVATSTKVVYWHRRNPSSVTFQYHDDYLAQTHRYYDFYRTLFEEKAPEYLQRATAGLKAQYFARCSSAVERELTLSPQNRTAMQMIATLNEIRRDPRYRQMLTRQRIGTVQHRQLRYMLTLLRVGLTPVLVMAAVTRRTLRSRSVKTSTD